MMRAWLCVGMLFAVGCHREPKVVDQPAPVAASPVVTQQRSDEGTLMAPVMKRMEAEKQNRPSGTPTVEQVIAAIQGAGIKLQAPVQGLGVPMKAHYCNLVNSVEGMGMSICEFDDEKGPAIGRDIAKLKFPTIKREWVINHKTLLTVSLPTNTPVTQAQRDKVVALFPTLTPPAAVTAPK